MATWDLNTKNRTQKNYRFSVQVQPGTFLPASPPRVLHAPAGARSPATAKVIQNPSPKIGNHDPPPPAPWPSSPSAFQPRRDPGRITSRTAHRRVSPPDEASAVPRHDEETEGNCAPPTPPGPRELAGRPLTTTPAPGAYARFLSLDASDWQTKTSPDATEPNAVSLDVRTSLPCRQLVPRDSGSGLFSHL